MNRQYNPTSNLARSAFVAIALTITVALGAFIDTLAYHLGPDGAVAAQQTAVVVARAE